MSNIIKTGVLTLCVVSLIACDNDDKEASETSYIPDEEVTVEYTDEPYYPYMEFCLQGSRLDIDPNTLKGDDCIFRTEGRNGFDMSDPTANAFFAHVSDFPALEEAGIDSFGINIKVGRQEPKISEGVYTVEPYSILSTENKQLPRLMVDLSPIDGDSAFAGIMTPDVEKLKKSAFGTPDDYPPYEILSATLTITHVEDIPLSEDEKERQKLMEGVVILRGQQYVKGTFTFSIKKFGPNGSNFGPETFTFGSINDWTFYPKRSE